MSIEQQTVVEFDEHVTLYRWACLAHPGKRGVWLKDPDKARAGMRAHVEREHRNGEHLILSMPPQRGRSINRLFRNEDDDGN